MGRSQKGICPIGNFYSPLSFPASRTALKCLKQWEIQSPDAVPSVWAQPGIGVLPDVGLRSVLLQFPPLVPSYMSVVHENMFPAPQQLCLQMQGSKAEWEDGAGETEQVSLTLSLLRCEKVIVNLT